MKFQFFKPKNELLKKYIEGFYFLNETTSFPNKYLTFPNNFSIVSFLQNASVRKNGENINIYKTEGKSTLSITSHYSKPWQIFYEDKIYEITIYFKPFGINQFLRGNFSPLDKNNITDFSLSENILKDSFDKILNNQENIQSNLEQFLLDIMIKKEDELLLKILTFLDDGEKIQDISHNLNLSRQYISRYFKERIGKSPTEYRKILRFRTAVKSLHSDKSQSLTNLTYDTLFFDQSHLIKNFRDLTNLNPKLFFNHLNLNEEIFWFTI